MKQVARILLTLALSCLMFGPALSLETVAAPAAAAAGSPQRRASAVRRKRWPRTGSTRGRSYINVDGERVPSPVFTKRAPAGATAQCRDGSYSFSRHRRGTCSRHGGVARWL
jgi:hypothetical protein